ncbi:hypothetical protein IQ13_4226 [Lacibacter cauensis]|uniref:Uncharacterized protein n=1 Tax=Lacibacter cauensis TaxID=510947 RepID=A0A562SA33_9BACT|nr:hypothetical protein IQ13_4226 [Lacibacter cauensis]
MTANVHSFAVGGAILLRRPRRRVLNGVTKDKILFKSQIDKSQPVQKLNSITGDDRRFASPPAAAKLHVGCCFLCFSINHKIGKCIRRQIYC